MNIPTSSTSTDFSATSTANKTLVGILIGCYGWYASGNKMIIGNINLEEGTTTSYEPYTGTTYPIYLGVENLFDKNGTLTSGYVEYNGSVMASVNFDYTDYIPIKPNTTYTTSGMVNGSGTAPSRCYYDKNKTFISGVIHNGTNPFIHTSPNNAYYMIESVKIVDLDTIQIEEGSKANSYTPYGTTPIELCKIGTYQDKFFKAINGNTIYDNLDSTIKDTLDYGEWYLEKNIGKVVLNGSEANWSTLTNPARFLLSSTFNVITDINNYSNYYVYGAWGDGDNTIDVRQNGIRINNKSSQSLEEYKTWLGTHNVLAYYPFGTPTYTKIEGTLETQLDNIYNAMSKKGQTNITQVNNDLALIINASALVKTS